jgi:ankyrin repeat protein
MKRYSNLLRNLTLLGALGASAGGWFYAHQKAGHLTKRPTAETLNLQALKNKQLADALEASADIWTLVDENRAKPDDQNPGLLKLQDAEKKIKECIDNGADPNYVDPNQRNRSMLHLAALYRLEGALDYLLKHGATNINSQDINGDTALNHAVASGSIKNVKLLLDKGADPNILNHEEAHFSALDFWAMGREGFNPKVRNSILKMLLDKGAKLNYFRGNEQVEADISRLTKNDLIKKTPLTL